MFEANRIYLFSSCCSAVEMSHSSRLNSSSSGRLTAQSTNQCEVVPTSPSRLCSIRGLSMAGAPSMLPHLCELIFRHDFGYTAAQMENIIAILEGISLLTPKNYNDNSSDYDNKDNNDQENAPPPILDIRVMYARNLSPFFYNRRKR